jgi:hypothetical protein
MQTIFKNILSTYADSLRGPAANRAYTIGASDIGQCSRRVFFTKHGGERDPGYVEHWAQRCAVRRSSRPSGYRRCAPVLALS